MVSKKHYSPRYHKHRDLARLAASPTSSSRKQYREMKSRKHAAFRARSRANLVIIAKTCCLCGDESISACPRCDGVVASPRMNRRIGHGLHDNLKHVRWGSDKLNPGYRWASDVKARSGCDVLTSRLRQMPGVAGAHLKFHIQLGANQQSQPGCTTAKLKRVFEHCGLQHSHDAWHLLYELARLAYLNKAEHRLAVWTWSFASSTIYADGKLWLPVGRQCRSVYWARNDTSIHLPLCNGTTAGLPISNNWKIASEDWRTDHRASGAYRPLYSVNDIGDWACDILAFFDTFYTRSYFSTAYGRWVLRYSISYLTEKGNH